MQKKEDKNLSALMPYKPVAGGSFPLQMAKYLCKSGKKDPLVCGSVVYRYIPLGFMFSKKKQKLGDPGANGNRMFLYTCYDLYMTIQYTFLSWGQIHSRLKEQRTGILFSNPVSHLFLPNLLDL